MVYGFIDFIALVGIEDGLECIVTDVVGIEDVLACIVTDVVGIEDGLAFFVTDLVGIEDVLTFFVTDLVGIEDDVLAFIVTGRVFIEATEHRGTGTAHCRCRVFFRTRRV